MEQTVLLNFEIDQSKAIRDYERLEKVIMDNRKAQQELTQAYKAQNITQEEYIAEQARLSQNLSKETSQRNTLKKVIEAETGSLNAERAALASLVRQRNALNKTTDEGLKKFNALNKQIKDLTESIKASEKAGGDFRRNVGNYPELAQAAAQVKVAGVSIDDLTASFTSFTGAATAVVGVLGSIAGAYAASATGARDLSNAQLQLSIAYQVAGENFARFINDQEESVGILEGLSIAILSRYVPAIYAESAAYADAAKNLRELEISRAFAAGFAKEDERRAEILRRIRDNEKEALDDRIAASAQIDNILETSKQRSVTVIRAEINAIKESTVGYEKNREAQLQVAHLTAEIADKEEEITGKLTENVTARRALVRLRQDELDLYAKEIREANKPNVDLTPENTQGVNVVSGTSLTDPAIQASDARIEQYTKELDAVKFTEDQKRAYYRDSLEIRMAISNAELAAAAAVFSSLSQLAKDASAEQKALALVAIGLKSAQAITTGVASSQDIPYPGNLIAAATTVATVLGYIAEAKNLISGFAEGGYTGDGFKYQPAGVVHKGEVVWSQRDVAAVGGPAAADRMRPSYSGSVSRGTYANGGIVTAPITRQADQQMLMVNAMKNLPTPEVSVKEITRAQDRVRARERTSKLAS